MRKLHFGITCAVGLFWFSWTAASEPPRNYFPPFSPISQETIDLYWNGMLEGCRRAFLFNGDVRDIAEDGDCNATDLSFCPTIRYWPQGAMLPGLCADFNGSTSPVENREELVKLVKAALPESPIAKMLPKKLNVSGQDSMKCDESEDDVSGKETSIRGSRVIDEYPSCV